MKPSTHILIEVLLGFGFIVLGAAFAYNYHQHSVDAAKVEGNVEGRAQQQKEDDEKLKRSEAEKTALIEKAAAAEAKYEADKKRLHDMTPQQIVSAAPNFIAGLPRPITIFQPGVTTPVTGDAIVPQEDVQVIAQNVLQGNHCVKDQLPYCTSLLNIANDQAKLWNHKFTLEDMNSKDWEKLAKGSNFGRKLKRCGILGAVGFGMGAGATSAMPSTPGQSKPVIRNGLVIGGTEMATCWFLK